MYRIIWWYADGRRRVIRTRRRNRAEYLVETLHKCGVTNAWVQRCFCP